MPRLKTALLLIFLCGFVFFSLHLKRELTRERSPIAALEINQPMRDFSLTDLGEKSASLSQLSQGNAVVAVNFLGHLVRPLPS